MNIPDFLVWLIPLPPLVSRWVGAQGDWVAAQQLFSTIEIEPALLLDHDHAIGLAQAGGDGHGQQQGQCQDKGEKSTEKKHPQHL